jgi:hypothetical protein
VTKARNMFEKLRERGEEVLSQISDEVVNSPYFHRAMEGVMKGRDQINQAAAQALKQMNIPTRSEFKKAMNRIDSLEQELNAIRAEKAAASAAAPAPAAAAPAARAASAARPASSARRAASSKASARPRARRSKRR